MGGEHKSNGREKAEKKESNKGRGEDALLLLIIRFLLLYLVLARKGRRDIRNQCFGKMRDLVL